MHFTQELAFEFGRLALVYVHLIACCVAIGLVLKSDVEMLKDLLSGNRSSNHLRSKEMNQLQHVVSLALAVLWATGAWIIAIDTISKGGLHYFANPKIQAKILLVTLLTLNGVVLHNMVLPWMQKAGSLLNLSFDRLTLAAFAGTVSAVTWMYAALMGVGRPLAWKYTLVQLMAAYPVLIAGGTLVMLAGITWLKVQRSAPADEFELAFAPTRVS